MLNGKHDSTTRTAFSKTSSAILARGGCAEDSPATLCHGVVSARILAASQGTHATRCAEIASAKSFSEIFGCLPRQVLCRCHMSLPRGSRSSARSVPCSSNRGTGRPFNAYPVKCHLCRATQGDSRWHLSFECNITDVATSPQQRKNNHDRQERS